MTRENTKFFKTFPEGIARLRGHRIREFKPGHPGIEPDVLSLVSYYPDGPVIWIREDADPKERQAHIIHCMGHINADHYKVQYKHTKNHRLSGCKREAEEWAAKVQIPDSYILGLKDRPVTIESVAEETGATKYRVELRFKAIIRASKPGFWKRLWRATA